MKGAALAAQPAARIAAFSLRRVFIPPCDRYTLAMTCDFYTTDQADILQAQRRAQEIVFGPIAFQVARILHKFGILELLASRKARDGKSLAEICEAVARPTYPVQVLVESALSSGILYRRIGVDDEPDRYVITKTGYLLYSDTMTRVLSDFMHDVCYRGLHRLEQALESGEPEGLKLDGDWPTLYEALSSLPSPMRESWFTYDHYFSDCTFPETLAIVFENHPRRLLDLGGNTGKWALQCVGHSAEVEVTVMDLPQQIALLQENIRDQTGADRIHTLPADLLDAQTTIPGGFDTVWMSQFLDCFSEAQICDILRRVAASLSADTRVYINEIFWDRQRFETASYVLNQSSPYFTAIANGTSKFLYYPDLLRCIETAGLAVEEIRDGIGWGHTLIRCRRA